MGLRSLDLRDAPRKIRSKNAEEIVFGDPDCTHPCRFRASSTNGAVEELHNYAVRILLPPTVRPMSASRQRQ